MPLFTDNVELLLGLLLVYNHQRVRGERIFLALGNARY